MGSRTALLGTLLISLTGWLNAATVSGRVVDARTGEPVAQTKVIVADAHREAITDGSGEFILEGLTPGEVELLVTTAGYSLVKKKIQISEAVPLRIDIVLNQEAAV